jgi:hypothetical protein
MVNLPKLDAPAARNFSMLIAKTTNFELLQLNLYLQE